eukprot:3702269-Pyramimonas_sp.AAC.1
MCNTGSPPPGAGARALRGPARGAGARALRGSASGGAAPARPRPRGDGVRGQAGIFPRRTNQTQEAQ